MIINNKKEFDTFRDTAEGFYTVPDKVIADKILSLHPYFEFVLNAEGNLIDITPFPEISYSRDIQNPLTPGQLLIITSEVAPVTLIDDEGVFREVQDGIIQYSNMEPGTYYLTLRADRYRPTGIEVIVNAP